MAKAFMCVKDVYVDDLGNAKLIYNVIVPGTDRLPYGADYILDPSKSGDENTESLKEKIADDAVSHGITMSKGDVIVFGAMVARDAASFTDKTNGITSDRTAVAKEATAEAEQPGLMARMWNWMTT